MHPRLIDVLNEVEEVEIEAAKLDQAVNQIDVSQLRYDVMGWILLQGLASVIEKVYSGYENAMQRIAVTVDGNRIQHDEGWHVALLRRMARPYQGVRPAVLSHETYDLLNAVRGFRHRERNTYGSPLDVDRTLENARKVPLVVHAFRQDLNALSEYLSAEDIPEERDGDGPGDGMSGGPGGRE